MKAERQRVARRLACILIFASLAWTTAPQLLHLARESFELQRLPLAARRLRVNGPLVASVKRVKRSLPPGEPVALIGPERNFSPVIFANYYGFPWTSHAYAGLDHYRATAGDPRRPRTIVAVGDIARIATYAELRDERLRGSRIVHAPPTRPAPPAFAIPLAGSVDGLPPDTYVIEADFVNDASVPATVRLTLMPEQAVKTLTIGPHATASFYDLVSQNFGVMEVRWIDVGIDQPLRVGVWFVNRGRREAVPLPFVTSWGGGILRCPAADCKVWLVNMKNDVVTARVGSESVLLPPHALVSRPFRGTVDVAGREVYAFASTKEPPTRFVWPPPFHQQSGATP